MLLYVFSNMVPNFDNANGNDPVAFFRLANMWLTEGQFSFAPWKNFTLEYQHRNLNGWYLYLCRPLPVPLNTSTSLCSQRALEIFGRGSLSGQEISSVTTLLTRPYTFNAKGPTRGQSRSHLLSALPATQYFHFSHWKLIIEFEIYVLALIS